MIFIPAVMTNVITSNFLLSISPGRVATFLDPYRAVSTVSQLVKFAMCLTSVLDFHSKNLQITTKQLTQGLKYHKL